jgi:sensor c-di-GMP phosphodiesterase-like protein
MMKLLAALSSTVLLSSSLHAATPSTQPACSEADLPCIRRLLYDKAQEAASWAKESGLLKQQVDVLSKANELLKADNESIRGVLQPAIDATKAMQLHWYEHPGFLIPVGALLGVILAVVAVFGVAQLQRSFPHATSTP